MHPENALLPAACSKDWVSGCSTPRPIRFRPISATPQAMTHFGVAYPSAEEVDEAMEKLASNPDLKDRISLSNVFRPGGPGSVDDRVVQAFVYTDIIAVGLLCAGQQIELQVRLDGV